MNLVRQSFLPKIKLTKVKPTSGASRSAFFYKNDLPLQLKHKKLLNFYKWKSGRSSRGHVVMWTKGSRKTKHRTASINYSFRSSMLGFIGGFLLKPLSNKLIALLFLATGTVTYVPVSTKHQMFNLTRLQSTFFRRNRFVEQLKLINKYVLLDQSFFLIKQLPKNQHVSLLEIIPNKGIQYVRSTGTSAKIVKMDSRISTSLVKLPSGVKKVFSTFSIGSLGPVALPENKKWKNNSAGLYKKFGRKSQTRGVAMNPVDHPHGGRAKSVKYQRTPWGKTTKFK